MDPFSHHRAARLTKAPWIERPQAFEPLDQFAVGTLPAIGSASTILQFIVPVGRNGVIRWIANEVSSDGTGTVAIDLTNAVSWSFLIDNSPLAQNYGNIPSSLGKLWQPCEISGVRVKENQQIQLNIKNGTLALTTPPQLVGARLVGWYYPRSLDTAFSS